VLIGLFAFSQLLSDLRNPVTARNALSDRKQVKVKIEHRRAIGILLKNWVVVIRSALIGMFTGILPGAGGSIANILSYDQAKKAAKDDSKFGKGDPRGIIAPEASNNAVEGGALTPLMALGIPGDITAAIMLGALLMHDIVPGPTFIQDEPVLAYSIYIAFFLASFIMIGMQSGVLRVFVLVTRIKTYVLATVILTFATIGVFALHNSIEDIWTLFFFGIMGFVMRQFGFPLAPMILGVVLGNIAELNLARALAIDADPMLFFIRPWSLFFAIVAIFSMIFPIYQKNRDTGSLLERIFSPLVLLSLSLPLFMMGGLLRTTLAVAAITISSSILWRRFRSQSKA
jgi:putative tricarboxylic transport membrane protein